MHMKYTAVLWDFDGTLADTGEDVWKSVEFAASCYGGALEKRFRSQDSNLSKPMWDIFSAVAPFPGQEYFEDFKEKIRVHYRCKNMYPNTRMYPGILETVQWVEEQKAKNYIVTLKPLEALERILHIKGWDKYFAGWLSPDSLEEGEKSKAELIAYVLEKQHLHPKEALYIGDTYSDVEAARANGLSCIGVTYGDGDTERLLKAEPEIIAETGYQLCRKIGDM